MTDPKEKAISSILAAERELKQALSNLEQLPAFDPSNVLLAAHSLNNYLSVISGIVDLLSIRLKNKLDEDICTLIENLGHTNALMRQTVNRLTHTSVVNNVNYVRKKVDFYNLIDAACDYYQNIARKKNIEIHVEKTASYRYAWTDAVAVAAILDNLLSNAIKYSDFGKHIWVSLESDPDSLTCTVRDEGPGIAEEDQDKLFDRGVKLGHSPTAGEPSTGFGLAVAKELTDKLGGDIGCRSRAGGATFFFRIPVSYPQ